jgi:SSS family solute:Na+ symporter
LAGAALVADRIGDAGAAGVPIGLAALTGGQDAIVLGAGMIWAAVWIGDVVNALTLAYNLLTGAIFVPILGAFFWKGATWQGALASIVLSAAVVVASMAAYGFGSNLPILYGLASNLAAFIVVSLLTGPPPHEKLERWLESIRSPPSIE